MTKILKVKKKELQPSRKEYNLVPNQTNAKEIGEVSETRRSADVNSKAATLVASKEIEREKRSEFDASRKEYAEYKDENGVVVPPAKLEEYQELVAHYYRTYAILTDLQQADLASKLPKKLNNLEVKVGPKAIFPPILDIGRKKVSRARIVSKMNRLKYISTDEARGLKLSEEDAEVVFQSYKTQAQAKKDLVKTLVSLSYNDYEICEYLDIKGTELARLKKEIFFEEIMSTRQMTNEERFAQYKMQQMEIVKDIDVLVEQFKETKQLQALIGALKLKSEITDSIIAKGMEFGVIEKQPEKKAVLVGTLDITTASISELEKEIEKTSQEISKLMNSKTFLTTAKKV